MLIIADGPPSKRRKLHGDTPPLQEQPDQAFNFNWDDAPVQDVGLGMDLEIEYRCVFFSLASNGN